MLATVADEGNDELHKRLMKLENGTEHKEGPVIIWFSLYLVFQKMVYKN